VGETIGEAVGADEGVTVGATVGDNVGIVVGATVRDNVGIVVGATVGDNVGVTVGTVGDNVGVVVGATVGDNVGVVVGATVGDNVGVVVPIRLSSSARVTSLVQFQACGQECEREPGAKVPSAEKPPFGTAPNPYLSFKYFTIFAESGGAS
jgi:hypothetical protein